MEYYSVIKKNEIMPLAATWMDLEIIILSKVSQTEKDKYHMILKRSRTLLFFAPAPPPHVFHLPFVCERKLAKE